MPILVIVESSTKAKTLKGILGPDYDIKASMGHIRDLPKSGLGVDLAGKTGTSEYKDALGKDGTHAWLSVFGPFEDATISLTVFLEGGGGGSDAAAPIAKELLDLWFTR